MDKKNSRKQNIAQAIKNARIYMGFTQAQVAEKLGLTYQAISNYERGINSIESDILSKMCKIYYLDVSSVLSDDIYVCPECGLLYNPNNPSDRKEHDAFCKASRYYEICYPWGSTGLRKNDIYDVLGSESSSFEEKCDAALELFKVYFSRSIGKRGYSLDHPLFNEYAAMLLNQRQFLEKFGGNIYNQLVEKYGKMPGIPEGETTYQIEELQQKRSNSRSTAQTKPASAETYKIENPDIRMVARAGTKMTPEQAENVRKYAQYMYPEAFEEDD